MTPTPSDSQQPQEATTTRVSQRHENDLDAPVSVDLLEETQAVRHPSIRNIIIQVVGFVISMALLVWCIRLAIKPENVDKIGKLWEAPLGTKASLLALSALILFCDGAKFWVVLKPIKKLGFWHVQAVNGIAALLIYAPFKLSIIWRFIVHNRRDSMPVLTIGAWIGAVGIILLGVLTPLIAVSIWRQQIDWIFVVAGVAGLVVMYLLTLLGAMLFAGQRGLARLNAMASVFKLAIINRLFASHAFAKAHAGFDMLASPLTMGSGYLCRISNLLLGAARFYLVAQLLGTPITIDTAVIASCTYFLVGVLSPSGSLGAREGATTGLASLLAVPGMEHGAFAPIAIFVSVLEIITHLCSAILGSFLIHPWKLFTLMKDPQPAA